MDLGRAPLLRLYMAAADPNSFRRSGWRCSSIHHLVTDHTGLEVVQEEIAALLAGRGDRLPEPLPFRDFVAQARLGVPREEHERYFAGLLGDVTETTAPFGLLDDRGGIVTQRNHRMVDPVLAARVRELARELGASPATLLRIWPGARVLAALVVAVMTWCSARCCSAGWMPGGGRTGYRGCS